MSVLVQASLQSGGAGINFEHHPSIKHWPVLELGVMNPAVFALLEQRRTGLLATLTLWLTQWRLKSQFILSKLYRFSYNGNYLMSSLNN